MTTYPFEFPTQGVVVVTTVNAPHEEKLTPATILGFVDAPEVFIPAYPGHASVFFTEISDEQLMAFLYFYGRSIESFRYARTVYNEKAYKA